MQKLIIVENPDFWDFKLADVHVITPSRYIAEPQLQLEKGLRILNLCKSYQYQSIGYYVSLLAEARKHNVLPEIYTLQNFRYPSILREDFEDFDKLIQTTFKNEEKDKVEFDIYLGIARKENYNKLAKQLFLYVQAPCLTVVFSKKNKWVLQSIRPFSVEEVPDEDQQ